MFEQLVVGGKVELFKKSRRIKENGETKEMLVSQIMMRLLSARCLQDREK